MVDVTKVLGAGIDADVVEAIEALALLVAVERVAGLCDVDPADRGRLHVEIAGGAVVLYSKGTGGYPDVPCCLNQVPAGFGLEG